VAEAPVHATGSGITLVLGGGGARGLAHAGILEVLSNAGIPVRAIVGTSIGAEVGAFYCAGIPPDRIAAMVREFDWMATLKLFWPTLNGGGLTSGRNIETYLQQRLGDGTFASCRPPLRALATDMHSGQQVILGEGRLVDAVRASIALPGIIAPHPLDGRLLGDGGLVNPLPVDVAREAFGGPVVAVAVHPGAVAPEEDGEEDPFREPAGEGEGPDLLENLRRAIQITQAQLVHWHLADRPPDLLLKPVVPGMGSMEFYRGKEALQAGQRVGEANLARIRELAGQATGP
jgi:NTE family protein